MDLKKILFAIKTPLILFFVFVVIMLLAQELIVNRSLIQIDYNVMGVIYWGLIFFSLASLVFAGFNSAKANDGGIIEGVVGAVIFAIIVYLLISIATILKDLSMGKFYIDYVFLFIIIPVALVCGAIGGFIASRKKVGV